MNMLYMALSLFCSKGKYQRKNNITNKYVDGEYLVSHMWSCVEGTITLDCLCNA